MLPRAASLRAAKREYYLKIITDNIFMVTLEKNIKSVKNILTSQDILVFEFSAQSGKKFAVIYADGVADKALIGELVIKPLKYAPADCNLTAAKQLLASPEVKDGKKIQDAVKEVSDLSLIHI